MNYDYTIHYFKSDNSWLECSELFKVTNDWFDVLNSKVPQNDSRDREKAYGLALPEQNFISDKMEKTMYSLKNVGSSNMLPFQRVLS